MTEHQGVGYIYDDDIGRPASKQITGTDGIKVDIRRQEMRVPSRCLRLRSSHMFSS
jgi:hypothetical protein